MGLVFFSVQRDIDGNYGAVLAVMMGQSFS